MPDKGCVAKLQKFRGAEREELHHLAVDVADGGRFGNGRPVPGSETSK